MACIAGMELATELDQIESDIAQVEAVANGDESIEDVLVDAATEELNAAVSSTIEGGDDDASAGPGSQKQKQTTKKKKK